jgi:hypothetical protein
MGLQDTLQPLPVAETQLQRNSCNAAIMMVQATEESG